MLRSKRIHWLALPALIVCCNAPVLAQVLQSGDPGFGRQWVRSNPLSLQAVSWNASTWDFNEYFAAGLNTLNLHPANGAPLANVPTQYADVPWHAFLPIATGISTFEALKSIPGGAGWIVGDEPNRLAMPSYVPIVDHVRQNAPDQLVYATAGNNTGNAAIYFGDNSNPTYTYQQYLNDFIDIIKPDVMMFDHYPLTPGGTTSPIYLDNIMAIRAAALAHNIPYWAWLQAFGRSLGREPSESDNRFNVFTHLTTGYSGFAYWTYDFRVNSSGDGLIDVNGNPTALYNNVAQSSAEIVNLGQALRALTSTDVRFVPGRHGPFNQENLTPQGLLDWGIGAGGDSRIRSLTFDFSDPANQGDGKDGLIGFFTDDDGQIYFMLTNLYHGANLSAAATSLDFVITFDDTINQLLRLNRKTAEQEVISLVNHTLTFTLPGGTGDLFKFNTGNFVIPEPATIGLVALGALVMLGRSRRKRA